MTKRKERSSPYPSWSINHCIELVTKIYSNFGGTNYFAKREEIAKVLGISAAHLQTQVSSANQYGLLELKSGEGYKPSKLFVSIHRPIDEESKRKALIEVFKSPSLYSALLDQFENELVPTEIPLSNIILHHHNISEGANERAAAIFLQNASDLKLIDDGDRLVLSSPSKADDIEEFEEYEPEDNAVNQQNGHQPIIAINKDTTSSQQTTNNGNRKDTYALPEELRTFNIPLKGNRTAQIVVPLDARSTDFDFIINFINLMKQQYE